MPNPHYVEPHPLSVYWVDEECCYWCVQHKDDDSSTWRYAEKIEYDAPRVKNGGKRFDNRH